jgi:hypothetical protein
MKKTSLVAIVILAIQTTLFAQDSKTNQSASIQTPPKIIKGQLIGPKEIGDVGNATPEAALVTSFWAEMKSQGSIDSFQGLQILARKTVASDKVELKFQFSRRNLAVPQKTKIVEVAKINGVWKVGINRPYEASWDGGSEPEPKP